VRVLDGAIAVFDGVAACSRNQNGLASGDQVQRARLAFINKMDRVGADFEMSVDSIHKKLGANAWPVFAAGWEGKISYAANSTSLTRRR